MGASDIPGQEGVELEALLDLVLAVRSWTEVRDLAVRHPALLTVRAWRELERRHLDTEMGPALNTLSGSLVFGPCPR
jgi:hypothetical protein